ncbi:MAG: isoprenylcysteine carboxylmethyltransferase family protein [Ignavibacteriae bacterium]|nr:MAG: isoprenylcysteine carboxylmethyltransferase family protein [Ignavibacteriota bacterium]
MTLGQFFFKNRSYTPIPFLIPLFLFGRPTSQSLIIGFIIAIIGELIRFWGVSYAGGETRTTKVGASNLVTQGPFAFIRNPLYLGNIFLYFGISIMANSLFPYLQIIGLIYFSIQYYYIIKEEESFLREKFKDKYEDYYSNVNSIIPSFKPYNESKQSNIKPNYKDAYVSEKRTFQSISISMIMILLIYALVNA